MDTQTASPQANSPIDDHHAVVTGVEHWTNKGDVPLFLWEKFVGSPDGKPAVLFVHGSSMASQPTFDLHRSRPARFVGDGLVRPARLRQLVRRHGRLRPLRQDARHLLRHRQRRRRPRRRHRLHRARRAACGRSWSTASRRARCARRCSRSAIPIASRGWRSTPSSGPAKARRRWPSAARSCPSSWRRSGGRSTARSCIRSSSATIPTAPTQATVEAFADAILALDDSMPNGTYIDMCSKLPVVDPAKITVPTIVMRGAVRRHRRVRRPDRVLQAAAQSGQAVHGDGRASRTRASSRRTT